MAEQTTEQAAPTASVEDRIGNIFGDAPPRQPQPKRSPAPQQMQSEEEPEEQEGTAPNPEDTDTAEPEQEASAEDLFEIEVDGEKFTLPKKLEKAVLQERDYTQKSQATAEKERLLAVRDEQFRVANMRQQFESEISQEIQQMQAYDSVLSQPVDWSAMTTDEAFRKKIQLDQWKDERGALEKQVQIKYQQWAQKHEEAVKGMKAKAAEVVAKRIPNWNGDTEKALREHAKKDGYTDVELDSATNDPRHTLTLWKAQQFDLLKSKATKTVVDAKSVKTSPSNPMPQHVKDKLSFRKEVSRHAPGTQGHKEALAKQIGKIFG